MSKSLLIFSLCYNEIHLSSLTEFCVLYSCQHLSITVNNFFEPADVPTIDSGR